MQSRLITWAKISWNVLLLSLMWLCSYNYSTTVYVSWQAAGQIKVLWNRKSFDSYRKHVTLGKHEEENLNLIPRLKRYSVDSLGYRPTANFTQIYDQGPEPVLWAITASEKYSIKPYYWQFPVVGKVSYKGFFDKNKAISEKNRLVAAGYDVDMRSVSAWSTLGWFSDPVLSSMLKRKKGSLCNLIFHELFHATYYAQSSVDFNENLASFIAHKATIKYLATDTAALHDYLQSYNEGRQVEAFVVGQMKGLNAFYDSIATFPDSRKQLLRLQRLIKMSANLQKDVPFKKGRAEYTAKQILESKNAWFVDFRQYSSLQDSLENVFNKIYKANIREMVQSLK